MKNRLGGDSNGMQEGYTKATGVEGVALPSLALGRAGAKLLRQMERQPVEVGRHEGQQKVG